MRFPFGVDKNEQDEFEVYSGKLEAQELQEFVYEAIVHDPMRLQEQSIFGFLNSDLPKPKVHHFFSLFSHTF